MQSPRIAAVVQASPASPASPPSPRIGRRRAALAGLAASLLIPLSLTAPPAAATAARSGAPAAGAYTVTPHRVTVRTGEGSCTADADLYRPAGVDRARPAPAVMVTNGFGGNKADGRTEDYAKAFADRGYVALVWSGLGFGKSGCGISLDDPRIDGRVASGLVDFLAGTRRDDAGARVDFVTGDGPGDPRVGMIGGSYGGAIQLATASRDHRLDALVPMITWNDLGTSLAPNAAVGAPRLAGPHKWQWTNGFYLVGESRLPTWENAQPDRVAALPCLHFVAQACRLLQTMNTGIYPDRTMDRILAYARSVSPAGYAHRVTAPTLLIQGQADGLFTLDEAESTYRVLRANGVPTKMIWQSAGHSGGTTDPARGELDIEAGNLETSATGRRILSWFDRYLHHREVGTGPAFTYYRDWITDPARTYAEADQVPRPSDRWYLSGDGRLVTERRKVATGARNYTNHALPTSHSESPLLRNLGLPDPAPFDLPGTHLAWTTEPLARDTDVVGSPRARLRVDSPAAERTQNSGDQADNLVLFAKLYDVAPDGSKTLVHRLIAPVRVPDVRRAFTVRLPSIVHRYEKGHRLQFVIAASDDAHQGNRGIKPVKVRSARGGAGVLDLPVVPARH